MAVAHRHLAEVYDRLGNEKNAAHYYARFIRMWRDCDPELRPPVDSAERALEGLTSETITNRRRGVRPLARRCHGLQASSVNNAPGRAARIGDFA